MIRMEHREDMTRHNWRYTWATRYNEVILASDWLMLTLTLIGQTASLLLVSGVMDEVDGALAVFEITETGEYKLK